jgi:hypothetical protein
VTSEVDMRIDGWVASLFIAFVTALSCEAGLAQTASPPPGYFDIPPGFDFPARKAILEKYITTGNLSGERLHAWNVFAGMTQPTPDRKYAIFETWYDETETFNSSASISALEPRKINPIFRVPLQFEGTRIAAVGGEAVLSRVLYNFAAFNHIRSNSLFTQSTLNTLLTSGTSNRKFPQDRDVPAFPENAIALKTVWWPIAKDKITAMPIWDPDQNPPLQTGNRLSTWPRYVGIDPTRANVSPYETADVIFDHQTKYVHVVGSDKMHLVAITAEQARGINSDGLLRQLADKALGRSVQAGDYAGLIATHLITKEIDDWVWATFWWHDQPDQGPFAANRPAYLVGVWRNYLMNASYDLQGPLESDGSPHVTFNPWLEAPFPDGGHGGGVVSNCMNCHNRASYPAIPFLPIYRGDADPQDPAFASGRLRTDYLWSIPDCTQVSRPCDPTK